MVPPITTVTLNLHCDKHGAGSYMYGPHDYSYVAISSIDKINAIASYLLTLSSSQPVDRSFIPQLW